MGPAAAVMRYALGVGHVLVVSGFAAFGLVVVVTVVQVAVAVVVRDAVVHVVAVAVLVAVLVVVLVVVVFDAVAVAVAVVADDGGLIAGSGPVEAPGGVVVGV